jgi:hypothetical protein
MVLYLLGAPSESSDASVGGVANWNGIAVVPIETGVWGGELESPCDGIESTGETGASPSDGSAPNFESRPIVGLGTVSGN